MEEDEGRGKRIVLLETRYDRSLQDALRMSVQSSDCTIVYIYIFSLNIQNAKIPPRQDCFLTIQQPEKAALRIEAQ